MALIRLALAPGLFLAAMALLEPAAMLSGALGATGWSGIWLKLEEAGH